MVQTLHSFASARRRPTRRPWPVGDFSQAYRAEHRRCERCGRPAEHAHHVQPVAEGGALIGEYNAESLCAACHAETHRKKPGARRGPASLPRMMPLGRDLYERISQAGHMTGVPAPVRRLVYEALRNSIQTLLPQEERDGHALTPEMVRLLIEEGLRQLRGADADPLDLNDEDLPNVFLLALASLLHTYDARAAGDDCWYDHDDLVFSYQQIARRRNEDLARHTVAPLGQLRLALAVAHRTIAKQIVRREGAASTTAVARELARHGLPNDGTYVKTLFTILADLPPGADFATATPGPNALIRCTDARFWVGHCRRWELAGASHDLPFIRRYYAAKAHYDQIKMQARLDETAAREGKRMREAVQGACCTGMYPPQESFDHFPTITYDIVVALPAEWREAAAQAIAEAPKSRF